MQPTAKDTSSYYIGLPKEAVLYLCTLLQTNNGQLRLLGVKSVVLENTSGYIEKWVVRGGEFYLEVSMPPALTDKTGKPLDAFESVPRVWLFHLTYFVVTILLAASILRFSYNVAVSLVLIAVICAVGVLMARFRKLVGAHVLAVTIGLGTPIVVCARLWPNQTLLLFLTLLFGIFMFRRFLF